jgi:hypothetical protein
LIAATAVSQSVAAASSSLKLQVTGTTARYNLKQRGRRRKTKMLMMKKKEKRGERKTASQPERERERERCLKHKCLVLGGKKVMICAEAKKQIRANLRDSRYGQKQQHSICEARGQRSMPVLAVPEERYLSLALVMAAAAINTTTT